MGVHDLVVIDVVHGQLFVRRGPICGILKVEGTIIFGRARTSKLPASICATSRPRRRIAVELVHFRCLDRLQRPQLAWLFSLSSRCRAHNAHATLRVNLAVAHLEVLHGLVHRHALLRVVAKSGLAGASLSLVRLVDASIRWVVLSLLANVRDRRVEVLPERLSVRDVLPTAKLFVSLALTISLVIDVRRELLFVQVVNDAMCWIRTIHVSRVCLSHLHWRFFC